MSPLHLWDSRGQALLPMDEFHGQGCLLPALEIAVREISQYSWLVRSELGENHMPLAKAGKKERLAKKKNQEEKKSVVNGVENDEKADIDMCFGASSPSDRGIYHYGATYHEYETLIMGRFDDYGIEFAGKVDWSLCYGDGNDNVEQLVITKIRVNFKEVLALLTDMTPFSQRSGLLFSQCVGIARTQCGNTPSAPGARHGPGILYRARHECIRYSSKKRIGIFHTCGNSMPELEYCVDRQAKVKAIRDALALAKVLPGNEKFFFKAETAFGTVN
ncbi:hypothetical protein ASPACDRAFT_60207 [Aspergillus aculeatus ATCC 16872]|uniref:Uncharacterized protein n=1 Tax=Aspergillus aculeatus (strain ATCC 16872 / CBS 172.66 / WB 5094) TaxID=690307 RepID=A0A1L9WVU6_ASPA1|nr:uncharacterized protein ASPACDRAFT_60207 [Aspergillus aculeatus ATCC 16872]OJK00371.1 hypothetical protein ASPACDRAFT_60207 [Aspergillus aculeatus ATCC 16872]